LVGLITQNDFDFCDDFGRAAAEVMTRSLITAQPDISADDAYRTMRQEKKKVLPLVDGDNRLVGMYLLSDLARIRSGNSATHNVDAQGRLRVAAAVGTGPEALERVGLLAKYADVIVIDTAHGDSQPVFETLREIKKVYDIDVVVGNISEGSSARALVDAGADGVKVGQGPGSICTTRVVAGIGCPQVTAIHSVARALEGSNIPICADGGIENSGDITIAIGVGAHSVMLGKLLAGTKEAPGEVDFQFGNPMKFYRGMGSLAAMMVSRSSRERYRQVEGSPDKLVPEGVEAAVPYVGDLETVMYQYLGGLRAGMGYVGAANIQELQEKADFYRISAAGIRESHPHGVTMLRDAPNYKKGREA
jgi:IMP dehydrogenase